MADLADCLPGLRASVHLVVAHEDTALAGGSGDVAVLATPRLLALAEQAAIDALGDCLPREMTSLGAWAEIEHHAPSPVGEAVTAEATLLGVHGRRLEFSISVTNDYEEVAHIRHHRIVAKRSRFEGDRQASA